MPDPDMDQMPDLDRIAEVLTRLRVMIGRRVISRVAISNVAPEADLSFIDVLSQIPELGLASSATVGTVAQAMRIDPSRASRLVSNMVAQGLLTRVGAPEDARSSYLNRTELGQRLHQEMRTVKTRLIEAGLEGWTLDEIHTFASQFERFILRWEEKIDEGEANMPNSAR